MLIANYSRLFIKIVRKYRSVQVRVVIVLIAQLDGLSDEYKVTYSRLAMFHTKLICNLIFFGKSKYGLVKVSVDLIN